MRALAVAAVAMALAAVGAGPARGQAVAARGQAVPARGQAVAPVDAVQAVLDVRAAAILAGDRDAFMATVDPRAPAGFREEQARSFAGWRSMPLAGYRLEARDDFGDLSPPGLPDRYGARTYVPETRQWHRLEGYDAEDAVDSLWLTFAQRGGRWYVAGDRDLEPVGLDTARALWELGPVRVRPTERLLVVSRPQHAERADALAAIAAEAVGTLERRWPEPWDGRVPLVLPGSVDELEVLLQSTFDLDDFVAFVSYDVVTDETWDATAPRIYVQDRNLSRYGHEFQVETLVHELAHAASVPLAGPFVDDWVHEGLADWVATGTGAPARPSGSDGRLPDAWQFRTGGGDAIVLSYREARSAIAFLAERWGATAPFELLRELGVVEVAPGSVDHRVGEALRAVTGLGLDELERAWARR